IESGTRRPADYSAPLAGVTAGRLEFARGAAQGTIPSAPMGGVFRGHFEGPNPAVTGDRGAVGIPYRAPPPAQPARVARAGGARFAWLSGEHSAAVTLNTSVAWALEVRGGVSRLDADLAGLRLTGLEITGGASHLELMLGQPHGVVSIRVRGGASHVTIWRPA